MALTQGLAVKQTTALALTPGLREAIALTRMTAAELTALIEREAETNPLIEVEHSHGTREPIPLASGAAVDIDTLPERGETLQAHLAGQINMGRSPGPLRAIALMIIGELDSDGFLRTPLGEFAARLDISLAKARTALDLVQNCEPSGIAAQSLGECFARQLADQGALTPALDAVLASLDPHNIDPLAKLGKAAAAQGMDMADVLEALRPLDPSPGAAFEPKPEVEARPDVLVESDRFGGWKVSLNPDSLPRVLMSRQYDALVQKDGEGAEFIRERTARAHWLVRALDRRAQSILAVASEIVRLQGGFFTEGVSALRPMTMREVAAGAAMHESTVSRVARGKYLHGPCGLFELRYFFGTGLGSKGENGKGPAARAVQARIKGLIAAEKTSRPLSDDRIVAALSDEGITIARRTVAKYRETMNIPSSFIRRKRNRSAMSSG